MSQIQGTDVVASMVVFEDGLARKSEYRRFIINGETDDVSAISEVLRRRFARYRVAREAGELVDSDRPAIDPETGRARKFAYLPNLVVVDGGAPQVNAAGAVLRSLGVTDVAVCRFRLSDSRRYGSRRRRFRSSCRGPPRGCTCCSGYAMRRIVSRSRSTGSDARSG